jgi:ArsR family transcriptional regulator, arsenate/arsenite/antimonite-responsive transcriptional repressor
MCVRLEGMTTGELDWAGCCTPLPGTTLDVDAAQRLAGVLKAIAEPTRLRLLSLVAAQADGEACICDLTDPVALSQPTVSHHMKILVDAGLLTREQRGRWAYYRLVPHAFDALTDLVGSLFGAHAPDRKAGAQPTRQGELTC